jgi:hypothetical protein
MYSVSKLVGREKSVKNVFINISEVNFHMLIFVAVLFLINYI